MMHDHGTTLDRFRLNSLVTTIAFAGRRRRVYRRIVEISGAGADSRVLDVGSSNGYLVRMLAKTAKNVTGVDPSEDAIEHARRRAPANATFEVGVAEDLSAFEDDSFDVVTSTLALHHIPARKRDQALSEMLRVLKPGGTLLIADFDPSRGMVSLHKGADRMRRAAATIGPLHELAAKAGFAVTTTGTLPLLRYVLATKA
jgi:ubiquinone/menaquinone biosynthesis C-methylase UbiE